jgi:hypothetical protein
LQQRPSKRQFDKVGHRVTNAQNVHGNYVPPAGVFISVLDGGGTNSIVLDFMTRKECRSNCKASSTDLGAKLLVISHFNRDFTVVLSIATQVSL